MESWFLINDTPNMQGTYPRCVIIIVEPIYRESRDRSDDFLLASESNVAGSISRDHRDTLQASALLRIRFLRIILIANSRLLITGSFLFRSSTQRFRELHLIAMTTVWEGQRWSVENGKVHLAVVFLAYEECDSIVSEIIHAGES